MNKLVSIVLGLSVLGCSEEKPQYSGLYEKTDTELSNPEFVGEKSWPKNLEIVHRMEYKGAGFDHYLGLKFIPSNENEAQGDVQFILSRLTNEKNGVYPNDHPNGDNVYNEKTIYGGAFCRSQVRYWVFAEIPGHEDLDKIYPSHDGSIGKDPTTGHELNITPQHPEEQYNEDAACRWFDKYENGLEIKIQLIRDLDSTTSGCYDFGGYLPPDNWGNEWSSAKYFSNEPDYNVNILEAGLGDLDEFDDPVFSLIGQLIPDFGSTN